MRKIQGKKNSKMLDTNNEWILEIDYYFFVIKNNNIAKVYIANNLSKCFCLYLRFFYKNQYNIDIIDFAYHFIKYKKLSN